MSEKRPNIEGIAVERRENRSGVRRRTVDAPLVADGARIQHGHVARKTLAKGGALSTAPAQWVIDIGVAGVDSPAEWAAHYIATKTVYVKEWIA